MNVRTSSYDPDPEADAVALVTLSGSPQLTPRNRCCSISHAVLFPAAYNLETDAVALFTLSGSAQLTPRNRFCSISHAVWLSTGYT